MDERIFTYKGGQPIPAWDLRHRLPTDKPVGPECKDTATIFRINSTYMDVTDQPYMYRQMLAGGVLVTCLAVGAFSVLAELILTHPKAVISAGVICVWLMLFFAITGFGYVAFKLGRDELLFPQAQAHPFQPERTKNLHDTAPPLLRQTGRGRCDLGSALECAIDLLHAQERQGIR